MKTIAITGASGFVGRRLVERFSAAGFRVRALVREPESARAERLGHEQFACDLPERLDPAGFASADVVVHAAYNNRHTTLEAARRVNEDGTRRVLGLAREAGARFVFLSSLSAHAQALSYYGKSKLQLEGLVDPARDLIVRPGLVLGMGGLVLRIAKSLRAHGLVPVFDGGRQLVQTVLDDDLAEAMVRAVSRQLTGTLVVAEPQPLLLRELFKLLAQAIGTRCVLLPVPASPLIALLRFAERLGARLPISSENVLGAIAMRPQESTQSLARLELKLRSAAESIAALAPALRRL